MEQGQVGGMGFTRALSACGGAVLAGALLLASAPVASANDGARAAEWPLRAYKAQANVWPHSTGKGVIVAMIDSGVRATHVDLTGQVLPGTDLIHGGNGQKDYSTGVEIGHGTSMASIIAGHGHGPGGEDGIMGLAPDAKILPIGVDPGHGDNDEVIARAIRYAVDHKASVINMSLGAAESPSSVLGQAVAYAESHNVVLVAASGNTGTDEDEYPASFPGVVSVGAVDENGNIWNRSTTSSHLTVTAPGAGIVSDSSGSDTQMYKGDGTSYSSAYVAAIAALIRSAYPQLTQGQVVNLIIKGADHSPLGGAAHDHQWGYGLARPNFALWDTLAKNPGPAAGPLPQAAGASAPPVANGGSSSAPGTGAQATGSTSSSGGSSLLPVVGGVVALLVVILVIVLIVRRKGRTPRGPGGPGGGYPAQPNPPYQPQQQQPYRPASQPQQPPYQQQPQQQQPYYQPPQGQPQQPPSVYQQNPYAQPPQQQQPPPYYGS